MRSTPRWPSAQAAGARIAKPAQATEWGGYHGYFADPDGHLWEVAHNPFWPIGARRRARAALTALRACRPHRGASRKRAGTAARASARPATCAVIHSSRANPAAQASAIGIEGW